MGVDPDFVEPEGLPVWGTFPNRKNKNFGYKIKTDSLQGAPSSEGPLEFNVTVNTLLHVQCVLSHVMGRAQLSSHVSRRQAKANVETMFLSFTFHLAHPGALQTM